MVILVLLYGCEIWGYENLDIIENIQINFLRRLLPVKKARPSLCYMGELCRTPLKLIIDQQNIGFWPRIVKGKSTNAHLLLNYLIRYSSFKKNGNSYNWLDNLISLFNNLVCQIYIYVKTVPNGKNTS